MKHKSFFNHTGRILLGLAGLLFGALNASAKLEWKEKDIYTSATAYDKQVKVSYTFVNKGDKPVTITWLRSSCGCLVPKVRDQVVAPGQEGEIFVVLDLDFRMGKLRRAVTVYTDDPEEPKIALYLHTELPVVIRPDKSVVKWTEGDSGTQKLTVQTDESVPVLEFIAATKDPNLDVKVEPVGPSKTYTVEITPKPNAEKVVAQIDLQAKIGADRYKKTSVMAVYR